jgi:hypothetical protein
VTVDVYTVIPELFIQLNPVCHLMMTKMIRPKMIVMPSAPYGFLSPLYNIYTTTTRYHINLVGEAIHFLVPTSTSNINVLAFETKTTQI